MRPHSSTSSDVPLPPGWTRRFFVYADLERSYRELDGYVHFHAEALRGRIRSLQLRFDEAWDHFAVASARAAHEESTVPNLMRQFALEVFRLENALSESPFGVDVSLAGARVPSIPARLLDAQPGLRYLIALRRTSEGSVRLHRGDYETAAAMFRRVVCDHARDMGLLAHCYTGLAACYARLGCRSSLLRNLQCAGLATQAVGRTLNMARGASRLEVFFRHIGETSKADEWRQFLARLSCPEETKHVFVEHASRLLDVYLG